MRHPPSRNIALAVSNTLALTAVLLSTAGIGRARAQQPAAQQPAPQAPAYDCREVLVPVRDGVRLQTVVVSPRDAAEPLPIIVQRTPYGVPSCPISGPLPAAYRDLAADGYVFSAARLPASGAQGRRKEANRLRPEGTDHRHLRCDASFGECGRSPAGRK